MNYIRCGMAQAKLTRIALRLRRESAINNNNNIPLVQMEITIVHFYLPVIRGVRFLKCLLAYNHTACDVS